MADIEMLLAQVAALQAELETLSNRLPEPKSDGTVIRWTMDFGKIDGPQYTYIAIRTGGYWYVSGCQGPDRVTWSKLWEWIEKRHGIAEGTRMELASAWLPVLDK